MLENLYVLYDLRAQIALKPIMCYRNDVPPVRELTEITNNPESVLHKHPEDFHLMHVGTLDLETMAVSSSEPRLVATALDLLKPKE